jgi:hypothetical protein
MGLPFVTRLPKAGGMYCPRDLAAYAQFICEACTVRSVLKRELSLYPSDTVLLMLERARLIDLTNHWARGTHSIHRNGFAASWPKPTLLSSGLFGPFGRLRPTSGFGTFFLHILIGSLWVSRIVLWWSKGVVRPMRLLTRFLLME